MKYGGDSRIADLERRCELLAALLGVTCEELDATWPDHQATKVRNKPPTIGA